MAGPEPQCQHGLLVGLHGVTRPRGVIDGITGFDRKPGCATNPPVTATTYDPVTFLGKMGMWRVINVFPLQA